MRENLFSYGTLRSEKVQLELFGRVLDGSNDTLNGYRLVSIEIADEEFLEKGEAKIQHSAIRSAGDDVHGIVFEISEEELMMCDKYEPDNYERIKIVLESSKTAWVYIAV